MFRGAYQRKLLTVLYSGGSNPLEIWDVQVKNGWTRRVKDEDMGTIVFEVCGTNVATAFIVSPAEPRGSLAISLPFITLLVKNLKRYFTFEIQVGRCEPDTPRFMGNVTSQSVAPVQGLALSQAAEITETILDDKQMRRRFRFSNYQSSTKVRPFTCSVPLALKPGWNQMQLNLANFTMRAYGTNYMETQRVQIHANCRIRRVYFSDRLYAEEELPRDYRIFLNVRQAPKPPLAEAEQQAPQQSTNTCPSSILKIPSKAEIVTTAPTVISETEVGKTSFKSSMSLVSTKNGSSVGLAGQKKSLQSIQWISDGEPERMSRTSRLRTSQRSVLLPVEDTALQPPDVIEEFPQGNDVLTDVEEDRQPEEQSELEPKPEPDLEHDQEGERVVDGGNEPDESQSLPESEYAESEPIPESDLELTDTEQPTD